MRRAKHLMVLALLSTLLGAFPGFAQEAGTKSTGSRKAMAAALTT